jgi:hypothetical protein
MMKKAYLVVIGILFVASSAFAGWSGADGDQKISYFPGTTGDFGSRFPRIVAGDGAQLYAVWVQGKTFVPYEVFFSKSTDNGRNWTGSTADRMISFDDDEGSLVSGEKPIDLAISSVGDLFVVWAESLTNVTYEIMLLKSTDGGDDWIHSDQDFPISYEGGNRALEPAIAVDHNDNLHVVWHQSGIESSTEILYGYSEDGGDTWTSQSEDRIISFPDGNHATYPDIAADSDNNIYVVWREQVVNGDVLSYAVHFGKKPAGETDFSSETEDLLAAMEHRSTTRPCIAIAPDNSVHVAYEARNQVDDSYKAAVYYTQSTDGGTSWSGSTDEVFVDYNPYDDTSAAKPSIVVTSTGSIAISYGIYDPAISNYRNEARVSYSTDSGQTWSGNTAPEIVGHWVSGNDNDNRPGYNPDICVSSGDTLHVVWNEDCEDEGGSSGYYEIMYSRGDVLAAPGPDCVYVAGDCNHNGVPLELSDVVEMISLYRGSASPQYTCDCPPHGSDFAAEADPNGNCVAFELSDVVTEIAAYRGTDEASGCPDCPGSR